MEGLLRAKYSAHTVSWHDPTATGRHPSPRLLGRKWKLRGAKRLAQGNRASQGESGAVSAGGAPLNQSPVQAGSEAEVVAKSQAGCGASGAGGRAVGHGMSTVSSGMSRSLALPTPCPCSSPNPWPAPSADPVPAPAPALAPAPGLLSGVRAHRFLLWAWATPG